MREFTDQELIRREKAEKIREMGIDPFGNRFDRTAYNEEIREKYKDVEHDEFENIFIAHSQNNSPNVDLSVIINAENHSDLKIGEIYKVKLTKLINNGFEGEVIKNDTQSSYDD